MAKKEYGASVGGRTFSGFALNKASQSSRNSRSHGTAIQVPIQLPRCYSINRDESVKGQNSF